MLLWAILAAMTGAAALLLLWPLARVRAAAARPDDAAFYRAALADIDRDAAAGLIGEGEARAARVEAARRLLRSDASDPASRPAGDPAQRRNAAALLALILAPAVALSVYGLIGSPGLPDRPLAARQGADPAAIDMAEALARIEAHLSANPEDGAGWEVVAPVYLRLGRTDDAVRAYAAALRLRGETPERLASLGEALVAQAGGVVTAEARERFAKAVEGGRFSARALFYLAVAREQDGDRAGAAAALDDLIARSPAEAPWLPVAREKLAALRGAPAGGEAIAALPEAERNAAIRAMVDGLAQRLAANGGAPEEWSRLIRSHMALGERDKAAQALADARRALAADDAAGATLEALSRELGL